MSYAALVTLVVMLAALVCGLSRQLGRPSGWFGRRVMGKASASSTWGWAGGMRST